MQHLSTVRSKSRLIILLILCVFFGPIQEVKANDANYIYIDAVCVIESGCRDLIGDFGKSIGPFQIKQAVVTDFNKRNGESYKHSDMRDYQKSSRVAEWYLNQEIPRMLAHFKIEDNVENRLTAYNAGIGTALKVHRRQRITPIITQRYIEKYRSLTNGRS